MIGFTSKCYIKGSPRKTALEDIKYEAFCNNNRSSVLYGISKHVKDPSGIRQDRINKEIVAILIRKLCNRGGKL